MKSQDMGIDNKTLVCNGLGGPNPDFEEISVALSGEVKRDDVDVHAKWQRQGFSGKVKKVSAGDL
jgi:hypothetical protein